MKIADYQVHTIISGSFALDGGAMFGVVPKTIWNKLNPADDLNRIEMVTRSVLLISEKRKILIDTGMGSNWSEKERMIYKIDQSKYNLDSELKKHGLACNDITDIVLSHLHFDHTGGSTQEKSGKFTSRFPNAKYYCTKENWNWANSATEKDRASYIKDNFVPLYDNGQLEIIENYRNFNLDCIRGIMSDGHTRGMFLPVISDDSKTVVYCADLIPTSSHIALPFIMSYDLEPLKSLEEKRSLLSKAMEEGWILVFEHDPKISAATVKMGKKYSEIDTVFTF